MFYVLTWILLFCFWLVFRMCWLALLAIKEVFKLLFLIGKNIWEFGRNLYKEVWLSFLFWLANTWLIGGRAYAGERVRLAQRVRLSANLLILSVFFCAISVSTLLTGGLTIPFWAMVLMGAGVIINFLALPISAAGNTIKIQTYYDAEWELQQLNNETAFMEQEPPHGILHSHPAQGAMLISRYLHDLNGLLGTIASYLVAIYDFFSPYINIFAPAIAGILLLFSRISGGVSASGATLTYKARLKVHTQNINDQIQTYYDISKIKTPILFEQTTTLVDAVFAQFPPENHKYYTWLRFRCFRAIQRALLENVSQDSIVPQTINMLNKVYEGQKISRKKLRHIQNGTALAVLDAMSAFEEKLYQELKYNKTVPIEALSNIIAADTNGYKQLFIEYFKSACLQNNQFSFNFDKIYWSKQLDNNPFFIKEGEYYHFNIEGLKTSSWAINTSHGKQLIPTYHLKKLAQALALQCQNVAIPTDEKSHEQMAEEIWNEVVPKDQENEYQFDDHEPLFHGVMFFCKKYLIEQLNANTSPEILKNKLKDFFAKVTAESSVKKFCGMSAYKSLNLARITSTKTAYETPWLTQASAAYSTLKIYTKVSSKCIF